MRVLYLSATDWRWARQRPQALAESLAAVGHEVHVRYRPMLRRSKTSEPIPRHSPLASLAPMPSLIPIRSATDGGIALAPGLGRVSRLVRSLNPDLLWITTPELWPLVSHLDACPVLFDCMDLTSAFQHRDAEWQRRVAALEEQAVRHAAFVLTSSEALASRLAPLRGGAPLSTVRNGYDERLLWRTPGPRPAEIGYWGTISEWFDFALVEECLSALPDIRLHLWGPALAPVPAHPRILHHGPVPHRDLPVLAQRVGALVMPFRLSALVQAVDPVKLYEYVATGLPCVASRYSEIERFEPWVRLYRDPAEFTEMVRAVLPSCIDGDDEAGRASFLASNSWKARAGEVNQVLATRVGGS